jgi:dTDP-4-amino-4,6-dideoxygalactose transaminase
MRSEWLTTGPRTDEFEKRFAGQVGADAALAVNSCTAALHLALLVFGVGPGDLVATTPMTFCSTVHAIEHVGATPLLVDVSSSTLNIDVAELKNVLAQPMGLGVRAILPVHYAGQPCDLDAIRMLARDHDLAVVEDAAHAFGASYGAAPIGATAPVPTLACFSFYATKNITTGEGGMLTGPSSAIERARVLSMHGMSRDAWRRHANGAPWHYDVTECGFKYNMSDLQAALGIVQLQQAADFANRRHAIARLYGDLLRDVAEIQLPIEQGPLHHAWHLFVIRLNLERLSIDRDGFIRELHAHNIGASVHFTPVHLLSYYRERYGFRPTDFPIAHREFLRIISLPIHPRMREEDVWDVSRAIQSIARQYAR